MVLVWEFIKAVVRHLWPMMSCAAFTGLGIYVAFANKPNSWVVRASFTLAMIMMIVAFYQAWREERVRRQYLEKEAGPNLLMRITVEGPTKADQVLELINDGTETATEVTFEEDPQEPSRILPLPWKLPYIRAGEPQRVRANFYKSGGSDGNQYRSLEDFLRGEDRGMLLHVVSKNSSGKVSFRKTFTIVCPILPRETHCFPGVRRFLAPGPRGSKPSPSP
jgi:hypothetical protein